MKKKELILVKDETVESEEEIKKKYGKLKMSTFHILLNSNKTKEIDPEAGEKIRGSFKMFYEHIDQFIIFNIGGDSMEKNIKEIRPSLAVEVGKNKHLIHGHFLIKLMHDSNIKMDVVRMLKFFNNYFGYQIKMTCNYRPDKGFALQKYLMKT